MQDARSLLTSKAPLSIRRRFLHAVIVEMPDSAQPLVIGLTFANSTRPREPSETRINLPLLI